MVSSNVLMNFVDVRQPVRSRLMRPDQATTGMRFPLVVFLHGGGERGDDNQSQLKYLPELLASPEGRRRYPCFALAPQCPTDRLWVEVPWGSVDSIPADRMSEPMQNAAASLRQILRDEGGRIDPARVYLTGISMGGFGTWYWGAASPELFAAIAPICGGGYEREAARLKDLPVWAVHGERDDVVPVVRSRNMVAAVRAAGGSPRYSELAEVGHDSWTDAYDFNFGLLDWLFAQRRT